MYFNAQVKNDEIRTYGFFNKCINYSNHYYTFKMIFFITSIIDNLNMFCIYIYKRTHIK